MPADLLNSIMTKIAEASSRLDIIELERLTKLAKRAHELRSQQNQIASELDDLARSLQKPGHLAPSQQPESDFRRTGAIRVEINWSAAGVQRAPVVVEDRKGSRALVFFLKAIHEVLGDPALEKLAKLQISRGPLVSRKPDSDFINKGNGSVYMHHRIPNTDYFVITHSGTTEKIEAIYSAARLLGIKEAVKAARSGDE